MGGACCKCCCDGDVAEIELNPDGTPKDPQDEYQKINDPPELRAVAKAADWKQMRVMLRRMPRAQINGQAAASEGDGVAGMTPLHFAVSINWLKGVKKLVRYGAKVNGLTDAAGKTPLALALETGKLQVATFLLSKKAKINEQDRKGRTPLLSVVLAGRKQLATWMIEKCDSLKIELILDLCDSDGNSAIMVAAQHGWFDIVTAWLPKLKQPKKTLNTKNKKGETVLGWVLKFAGTSMLKPAAALELAQALVKAGASVAIPAFQEQVPLLHLAAATNSIDLFNLVKAALPAESPAAAQDRLKRSALHFAAAKGADKIVPELLKMGVMPFAPDAQGNTPLHLAAMGGHNGVVQILMRGNVDTGKALLTPNLAGLTVYHLSLMAGNDQYAQDCSLDMIERLNQETKRRADAEAAKNAKNPKWKAPEKITPLSMTSHIMADKGKVIKDTVLMTAIKGHQDRVVAKLLEMADEFLTKRLPPPPPPPPPPASQDAAGAVAEAVEDAAITPEEETLIDEAAKDDLLEDAAITPKDEEEAAPASAEDSSEIKPLSVPISPPSAPEMIGSVPAAVPAAVEEEPAHEGKVIPGRKVLVNTANASGEFPLARNLASVTGPTYDSDALILDMLLSSGADINAGSDDHHPLIAVCKNSLSNFAKKAVAVMSSKMDLNWNRKDTKGFTPLMLASRSNNAWLVRYIIDEAKQSPNHESQRTKEGAPVVVGQSGCMCCTSDILGPPSTPGGLTPLMCAAKAAATDSIKILIHRGANVNAVDDSGKSALCHAMHLDKRCTLQVAQLLLAAGAHTTIRNPKQKKETQITDITGETWVHRAVRFGVPDFIECWAAHGGDLAILATTPETAADMPGAEPKANKAVDNDSFINMVPSKKEAAEEEEDTILEGEADADGEDSEAEAGDLEGPGAVGEGLLDDLFESKYAGPTREMLRAWKRRGIEWWQDFFGEEQFDLPPLDQEPDLGWQDRYNSCKAGEDDLEEEDIMEAMLAIERRKASMQLPRGGALRAIRTAKGARSSSPTGASSASMSEDSDEEADSVDSPRASLLGDLVSGLLQSSSPKGGTSAKVVPAGAVAESVMHSGVVGPLPKEMVFQGDSAVAMADATMGDMEFIEAMQDRVERLAFQAARELGFSDEIMREYGLDPLDPPSDMILPGPVAEAAEKKPASMTVKAGKGDSFASGTIGAVLWANEPYYKPETRYQGVPKYLDETVWPWWPKVDCSEYLDSGSTASYPNWYKEKMAKDSAVKPASWWLDSAEGPWNAEKRLGEYSSKKTKKLDGPPLRRRNIDWYLKSMSPEEFPLKAGQWRSFLAKKRAAIDAAGERRPGGIIEPRSKSAWYGMAELPTRPELNLTSPMVLAVRLNRPDCVATLTKLSDSVSVPDGFGNTPIQYALLLLAKDRHDKELKRLVDLLLVERPLINRRMVVQRYMAPRAAAAAKGVDPKSSKSRALLAEKNKWRIDKYNPQDFPSIMDPLVLGAIANDMPRIAWMVFKCGGNLNDAYVALSDIPIYFQGMFENMVGQIQSCAYPLHVAVLHKRHESVRLMLDMGADPNVFGSFFITGDPIKSAMKKASIIKDRTKKIEQMSMAAAKTNPMMRMWTMPEVSITAMIGGVKQFLDYVSDAFSSRPEPWVSVLHLSCRFGQAPITYLLIKRGAAANGGGAAAFAKKSPLEEALMYARDNAQSYNFRADRPLNCQIESGCFLAESDPAEVANQKAQLDKYNSKIDAMSETIASNYPEKEKKTGGAVKAEAFKDLGFEPNTLALFGKDDLQRIAMPEASTTAKLKAAAGAAKDIMSAMAMDPVAIAKLAFKAVAMIAKKVMAIYFEARDRPVSHYDPALATAHVLLFHRAPYNPEEAQTKIVLRDMIDNDTFDWLKLDRGVLNVKVIVASAVDRINALKANEQIGYMKMDTANDMKHYRKAKIKLEGAIDNACYQVSLSFLGPAYYLPNLVEHLSGKRSDGNPAPVKSLAHLESQARAMLTEAVVASVLLQQEKLLNWCIERSKDGKRADATKATKFHDVEPQALQKMSAWAEEQLKKVKAQEKQAGGMAQARAAVVASWPRELSKLPAAFKGYATKQAKAKLPYWYLKLKPGLKTAEDVIQDISTRFAKFDPDEVTAEIRQGCPQKSDKGESRNPWDVLLTTNTSQKKFNTKIPDFPSKALEKKARSAASLTTADVVKAVEASYIQIRAKQLREEQHARSAAYLGILKQAAVARHENVLAMAGRRKQLMAQTAADMKSMKLIGWDVDTIINSCMAKVDFEVAANKLGPCGPSVMAALSAKLGGAATCEVTGVLVDVAAGLGKEGLDMGAKALLEQLSAKAGLPAFEPSFVSQLSKVAAMSGDEDALAAMEGQAVDAMTAALPQDAAQQFMDGLVSSGALDQEALESLMSGGIEPLVQGGISGLMGKLNSVLPEDMQLDEAAVEGLKDAVLSGDAAEAMMDVGADLADDLGGALLGRTETGKALMKLQKAMGEDGPMKDLMGEMQGNLESTCGELGNMTEKLANGEMPSFVSDMPSVDAFDGMNDEIMQQMMGDLDLADFDLIQETVLGLDLDLAEDFESLVEAMECLGDALTDILDLLG